MPVTSRISNILSYDASALKKRGQASGDRKKCEQDIFGPTSLVSFVPYINSTRNDITYDILSANGTNQKLHPQNIVTYRNMHRFF